VQNLPAKDFFTLTTCIKGPVAAACRDLPDNFSPTMKIFLAYAAGVCTLRTASGKDRLATAGSANRV
jgi:hypothetical protein